MAGKPGARLRRPGPSRVCGTCHVLSSAARGFGLTLLLAAFEPAHAQQPDRPGEVHHRNECRLAAQVLRTGEPRTKTEWARGYIGMCREEGPVVLGQMWRSVGADSAESHHLLFHSSRIGDARLYGELRRVVADRNRPDVVRVAAMLVLVRYANPDRAIAFVDVAAPAGPIARIPLVHRWSSGSNRLIGAVPLPSRMGAELVTLFTRIAQSEPENRAVMYAAAVLAKRIQTDVERGRID